MGAYTFCSRSQNRGERLEFSLALEEGLRGFERADPGPRSPCPEWHRQSLSTRGDVILRGVAEREGGHQRAQGLVLPPVGVEKASLIRWLFSWALQDA